MSAMIHDVGSVVSFVPSSGDWVMVRDVYDGMVKRRTERLVVVGFATVVTRRDSWVVSTKVVPMVASPDGADVGVSFLEADKGWRMERSALR